MTRRGSVLVALIGLAAYGALCPPVSGMGDSSEFALALATGGVAHPTGYLLYALFGHYFCALLHALGFSWSYAAGLWSAVGGAVALYFLHALGMELIGEAPGVGTTTRFLAALVPLSLFAFQPIVLGEATRAEVNIWSLAWQWEWLEPSLAGVVAHITGAQYPQFVGYFAPSSFQKELLASAAYPFLFPGLALLLLGVLRVKDVERRIAWSALLAAAMLVTIFNLGYGVPDPAPYFLPALALGVPTAAPAIAAIPGVGSRVGAAALGTAGLAGLFLIVLWLQDGSEERAATMAFEKVIRSMWSAIPPDTAIVSWTDDRFDRLVEYQILRGEKPAVLIVTPDLRFASSMRRTIRERFGVDPLEGFDSPRLPLRAPAEGKAVIAESRQRLVRSLNERIRVPVILFDPTVPIVWQLRKPWEPADEDARPLPSAGHWVHPPLAPGFRR